MILKKKGNSLIKNKFKYKYINNNPSCHKLKFYRIQKIIYY